MRGEASDSDRSRERAIQMEAIVAEYETPLLRYTMRIVRNPHHAQDVVQNTFVKLMKMWQPGMQPGKRLKGWLYRVSHNEAIDLIRKESRRNALHERHAEEVTVDCPDGHNCPASDDERAQLVMRHVHKLKPAERQILLLRLEEGLSYKEITEVTGRTVGNVGCILHNAVKKLSGMLAADGAVSA
jgi:RNA polymerase sigma factor (sigma-70 family)